MNGFPSSCIESMVGKDENGQVAVIYREPFVVKNQQKALSVI